MTNPCCSSGFKQSTIKELNLNEYIEELCLKKICSECKTAQSKTEDNLKLAFSQIDRHDSQIFSALQVSFYLNV